MIRTASDTIKLGTCIETLAAHQADPVTLLGCFSAAAQGHARTYTRTRDGKGELSYLGVQGNGPTAQDATRDWIKSAKQQVDARARRAAMLESDVPFQGWIAQQCPTHFGLDQLSITDATTARLRTHLQIDSRRDLSRDRAAMDRFDAMLTEFERAAGRICSGNR